MNRVLLKIFMLLLLSTTVWAQTRTLTGNVSERESKEPIAGASVSVKGTTTGTQTTVNGEFKLSVSVKPIVIVVRSIGYKAKEYTLAPGQTTLNVTLENDNQVLNEVVAIGYQTVRRRDLNGAVSSVSSQQLASNPLNSTSEALEGRLAGVQITTSEGLPGASADVYVRGRGSITQSGSPLYVVDGVQLDNALNVLSPQDIESIDVLKDAASTAIYGSRGANGVIIITTKGGKNLNGKSQVIYSTQLGIQKLANKLDVMDPYNYVLQQYERFKITNDSSIINRFIRTTSNFDTIKNYRNVTPLDWQDRMFGRNAFFQHHNLSITGGNDRTQYNLSTSLDGQEGILLSSQYDRKLVNFRFDQKVSDRLKVGFNVRYNNQVVGGASTSDITGGAANTSTTGSGYNNLRQIVRYQPFLQPGQSDSFYDQDLADRTNSNSLSLINPQQLIGAEYRKRSTSVLNINGNANFNITKKLSIRSVLGYDVNMAEIRAFDDTITPNSRNNGGKLPLAAVTGTNVKTINNSNVIEYNNPSFLKSKHAIDVLAGQEIFQTFSTGNYLELRGFPPGTSATQAFANYQLASSNLQPTSTEVTVHHLSYFGRINYNYAGRYYLTLTARADGSSIFGPKNRWGYFPSISGSWRISDEKFMKNQHIFSDLKLRGSYGTAGNDRITPFSFYTTYSTGKNYYLNDLLNVGLGTNNLGNSDLKWETKKSKNLGIDMSFLKDRIQLSADFYYENTNDLLINASIPPTSGYITQYQNVGSVLNKGVELQLNGTVVQTKNFKWTGNFNIAFNKNTIQSLGRNSSFTYNSGWFSANNAPNDFLVKVGEEVGTMYGLVNDGYYTLDDFTATPYANASYPWATTKYTLKQGVPVSSITTATIQPGTQKFKDLTGDGVINGSDYVKIGNALPKFIGGFNQSFAYKNFDATLFFNFSYGNKEYNYNKLEFTSAYSNGANLLATFNDRWHVINPGTGAQIEGVVTNTSGGRDVVGAAPEVLTAVNGGAKYWIPGTGVEYNNPQSFAVEDASFIRLNNIQVGYTLPKNLLSRYKISNLRVSLTANNLALISSYSGYDPDVSVRRSSPLTPGVDYSAYPKARTYTLGLNVTF